MYRYAHLLLYYELIEVWGYETKNYYTLLAECSICCICIHLFIMYLLAITVITPPLTNEMHKNNSISSAMPYCNAIPFGNKNGGCIVMC